MYLLVEFTENKELAIIPDNWKDATRTKCGLWPPFQSTTKLTRAVIHKEPPLDSWKSYPIRELYKHETYEKVRSKLKRAEEESDLQSDQETYDGRPVRRKRSPNRYSSDSESDEQKQQQPQKKTQKTTIRLPTPPRRIEALRAPTPPPGCSTSITQSPTPAPAPSPMSIQLGDTMSYRTPQRYKPNDTSIDIRLFTFLEELKQEQTNQTTLLRTILSQLGQGCEEDQLPEGVSFPISNVTEMAFFEKKMNDKNVKKAVINHLNSIGGTSADNMAFRILKHVVTNQLAEKYNWTGANHKLPFRSLQLPSILKWAVKTTYKQVSSADIEGLVKSFLKSAKDRDGGRLKRMKTSAKEANTPQNFNDSETDSNP